MTLTALQWGITAVPVLAVAAGASIKRRSRTRHQQAIQQAREAAIAAARVKRRCDRDQRQAHITLTDDRGRTRSLCLGCYQEGLVHGWWPAPDAKRDPRGTRKP